MIPILQTLYHAPDSTSHHIYMSLIILLILSEDDGFNKSVHQIVSPITITNPSKLKLIVRAYLQMLKTISWYTERSISEISLGGLLVLVVIRTIQYNMLKMRDKYLHTNCLAALANMSGDLAGKSFVYIYLGGGDCVGLMGCSFCVNFLLSRTISVFASICGPADGEFVRDAG